MGPKSAFCVKGNFHEDLSSVLIGRRPSLAKAEKLSGDHGGKIRDVADFLVLTEPTGVCESESGRYADLVRSI